MQRSLIIGLLAALILTVFAIRNDHAVELYFLWGKGTEGPLSLILLVAVIIGVLLGIVFSIPSINKQSKIINSKNKEIDKLNNLVEGYKKEKERREKKQ
ncbi:MAG: LapA family protein [Bacteroidales bacterium]